MKGALNVAGDHRIHVFQAVRELFEIVPALPWDPRDKRTNRVLIVGRELNTKELEAGFKACFV